MKQSSYDAFVTYAQEPDRAFAVALQRSVEGFAPRFQLSRGARLFVDHRELAVGAPLWSSLEDALKRSRFLVLLASPEAARSTWVQREIDWWLEHRDHRSILVILTAGVVEWDHERGEVNAETADALPPRLASRLEAAVMVDARAWARTERGIDRRSQESTDTAASLLSVLMGRDKSALLSENVRRLRRFLTFAVASVIGLVLLSAAAVVFAIGQQRARDDAEEKERQAQSLALAKTASEVLPVRPDVSALLALDAYRLDETTQARGAVIDGLTAVGTSHAVGVFHGPGAALFAIAVSPDGRTIATGGSDRLIRLWNTATMKLRGSPFRGSDGPVAHLGFVRGGKSLVSTDGNVLRLWDVATGTERAATRAPDADDITSLAVSVRGDLVATGTSSLFGLDGAYLHVWDATTGKISGRSILTPSLNGIQGLAFAPNGRTIATGGDFEGGIEFYDLRRRARIGPRILADPDWVTSLAYHPDGKRLASVGADGRLREWDPATGRELGRAAQTRTDRDGTAVYSSDGRSLLTAGEPNGLIRRWVVGSHEPEGRSLTGHTDAVAALAVAENGAIASASSDGTARLWQTEMPAGYGSGVAPQVSVDNASNEAIALSPDGTSLVVAFGGRLGPRPEEQGPIGIWRMSDRRLTRSIGTPGSNPEAVAFSRDGSRLLVVGAESAVYDGRTFALIRDGLPAAVSGAIGPDNRTIALASPVNETRLWDIESGKPVGALHLPASDPTIDYVPHSLAFGLAGDWLASTTDDDRVRFYSTRTGRPLGRDLVGHTAVVWQVRTSEDGRTIATASGDKTVRLWDVATRRQIGRNFSGHQDSAFALTFSSDDKTLVSAGWDGTIRLWDVASQQPIGAPLRLPPGERAFGVTAARPGRSGDIVALDDSGEVHVWSGLLVRSKKGIEGALCGLIGTGLSESERRRYALGLQTGRSCLRVRRHVDASARHRSVAQRKWL